MPVETMGRGAMREQAGVTRRTCVFTREHFRVRLFVMPVTGLPARDVCADLMTPQTLRVVERHGAASRGCERRTAGAGTWRELPGDATRGDPAHIHGRTEKRTLQGRLPIDPAEAGDLANRIEAWNDSARPVDDA